MSATHIMTLQPANRISHLQEIFKVPGSQFLQLRAIVRETPYCISAKDRDLSISGKELSNIGQLRT
jgi:hypothetical protein